MVGRGLKKLGKKAHQPGRVSVMWLPGWPCAGLRRRTGRCLSGCRVRGCFALHNVFLLPSIFIPRACRLRAQHIRGDAIFRQSDLALAEISQHPPLVVGAGDHGISSLTHPLSLHACISPGLFCSTRANQLHWPLHRFYLAREPAALISSRLRPIPTLCVQQQRKPCRSIKDYSTDRFFLAAPRCALTLSPLTVAKKSEE